MRPGHFARRYLARRICFRFLPLLICLSSGSNPSHYFVETKITGLLATGGNYVIRPPGDRSFAGLPRYSHSAAAFFVLRADRSTDRRFFVLFIICLYYMFLYKGQLLSILDPSEGSPTDTLLQLDKTPPARTRLPFTNPKISVQATRHSRR